MPLELFEDNYPRDVEGSPGCPDLLMVVDVKNKGTKHPQASIRPTPEGSGKEPGALQQGGVAGLSWTIRVLGPPLLPCQ